MNNLIKKHAKSFYWASFFLSKPIFNKCSSLYNFCRTLDDIVDDNKELEIKKENFLKFKKDFINKDNDNPIIKEMWSVIDEENISKHVVIDLFDGVQTDLEDKVKINSVLMRGRTENELFDLLEFGSRTWRRRLLCLPGYCFDSMCGTLLVFDSILGLERWAGSGWDTETSLFASK